MSESNGDWLGLLRGENFFLQLTSQFEGGITDAGANFKALGTNFFNTMQVYYNIKGQKAIVDYIKYEISNQRGVVAMVADDIGVSVRISDLLSGDASIDLTIGNDTITGGRYNDVLYGMKGEDILDGREGADKLWGGEGNDELYGGEGNDVLMGGSGDDILYGHLGNDKMVGGLGRDTFVFYDNGSNKPSQDVIVDFNRKSDRLDLRGINDLEASDWIGDAEFSGKGGEIRMHDGLLQYDEDGDKRLELEIKLKVNLTVSDIDF